MPKDDPISKIFRRTVKERCVQHRITPKELSQLSGVDYQTCWNLLTLGAGTAIRFHTAVRLAKALRIDLEQFKLWLLDDNKKTYTTIGPK